jgi:proteasome lid subunit RPN8/RPN11
MSIVKLPRPLVNELLHQAQYTPEAEVCGLIASKDGQPQACYPVANIAHENQQAFQMDPQGQIDAMRTMRGRGEQLFAIYHSHPHAPALPSSIDLQQSEYPEVLHLIISLDTEGVLQMRGFYIEDTAVTDVALELE